MGCAEVLKQEKTAGVRYIPELDKSMETTFNYIKHSSRHPFPFTLLFLEKITDQQN